MRFEISHVLDAIEARLTLDPALARAVVDLAEVVRLVDLDGNDSKPATLLRLGRVLDALGQYLAEDGVAIYVVADRSVLSDLDLTSNERMVVRRWADDGLVEVLPDPADRVLSVAELLGVPVVSRRGFTEYAQQYRWLPRGLLAPTPAGMVPAAEGLPGPAAAPVLVRLWQCPESACAGFGAPAGGQPPPQLQAAVPTCPRHGTRLRDAGPQPPARVFAVRVDGAVRGRFVVREASPVVIGRAPSPAATGTVVELGPLLGDEALRWISRNHLWLELRGQALVVTDTSTNGTTIRTPAGPAQLGPGQAYGMGNDDVVELFQGVELGRPNRFQGGAARPASVMGEAPTISLRMPR
ncbi:FHA domain-containing protein [Natronosporangium hydrolyticum]|uniref:FHA domain-containing protein n=1 Tax=Natronosporangium hydrolyticum TaxID=2811111 RepID=A0A895YI66_9ACTN|nr:FHA domain-containing protein [Natronosporangium hydrolyticum]QSB15742.1 FHA domain-containing protein [Natronosporangium hydrolyticum]